MWFDQQAEINALVDFFRGQGAAAANFGRKVWQTFEAVTFAKLIRWYRSNGWTTTIENPTIHGRRVFRLKYSTRGDPANFSYVRCARDGATVQIRHQLRVETYHNRSKGKRVPRANIVCDVAVVKDGAYDHIKGRMHVFNTDLITFAEAKHMDAYAELIAGFIGLVHELQPSRLRRSRNSSSPAFPGHPLPFLHLSGICHDSGEGLKATIRRRRFGINVFDARSPFV